MDEWDPDKPNVFGVAIILAVVISFAIALAVAGWFRWK